ncbi:MAG: hypothetical protein M3336_07900, partial [Chloroflexota bacterium]|nr:hypothetical protein [Chloroflexota bacterium]
PHASGAGGYQVALTLATGDVPLAAAMADWRAARELADQVCQVADLPLDELTQRMFSRVGQFGPSQER